MSSVAQVLPSSAGWATVIALGLGFSLVMVGISFLQKRYTGIDASNNDEFSSASRSVKSGLIASGIVSAWTWAATLLQSSAVATRVGVSGSYWYASGATVQVLLFAMISCKTKINAPFATTYLQIIKARWGTLAHVVFLCFALATNALVSAMLVVGGAETVNSLTGMPIMAAVWLTPLSVAVYALVGGMRSTLLADYSHTVVLLVLILVFAFTVYATGGNGDFLGSPQKVAALLEKARVMAPVDGNGGGGSYLTFRSLPGLKFGIINICGNFATVFADQSYHQRGIASNPSTSTKAFILGGMAWWAVPMTMASALGLGARALMGNDPLMAMLSAADISAGLPAPAAAAALLGKSGAAAMLVLLYLAVTSSSAAQLIAVSSVLTFDVYQPYIRPTASKNEIGWAARFTVGFWAIAMGCLGTIFYYAGISLGWIYTFMGIAVAPAVFPIFSCITLSNANGTGAIIGALSGLVLGVMTWLVSAAKLEGSLTVATTGSDNPLVAGNLISIIVPTIICLSFNYFKPSKFDFGITRAIGEASPASTPTEKESHTPESPEKAGMESPMDEKTMSEDHSAQVVAALEKGGAHQKTGDGLGAEEISKLNESFKLARTGALALTFILIVFVPCMAVIPRVWTAAGLGAWISISIAWLFFSCGVCILLPIWESREALGDIFKGIGKDLKGGNGKVEMNK